MNRVAGTLLPAASLLPFRILLIVIPAPGVSSSIGPRGSSALPNAMPRHETRDHDAELKRVRIRKTIELLLRLTRRSSSRIPAGTKRRARAQH